METTKSTQDPLHGFPIVVETPVRWGDMDAMAHVNNTVYFRYFEIARIAYFDAIGFRSSNSRPRIGAILASAHCRFRIPLTYPDTVRIGARVVEIGEDRFTLEQRIVSTRLGDVAAIGGAVVVSFDYAAGRKAPIPEHVRRRIEALESGRHLDEAARPDPESRPHGDPEPEPAARRQREREPEPAARRNPESEP